MSSVPLAAPTPDREWQVADVATLRLPPNAFPDLPAGIVRELERRGCSVPQLDAMFVGVTRPHNVVRGSFGRGPEPDWAVLCSRDRVSAILVFWDGRAEYPAEIEQRPDAGSLQHMGEQGIVYSRYLGVASRNDIHAFHDAYGGPEPPPIENQGINDGYAEKGSSVLYWHDGTWLQLTGAD